VIGRHPGFSILTLCFPPRLILHPFASSSFRADRWSRSLVTGAASYAAMKARKILSWSQVC
jgi:hypothetical protein